jgi:hypothetical protein
MKNVILLNKNVEIINTGIMIFVHVLKDLYGHLIPLILLLVFVKKFVTKISCIILITQTVVVKMDTPYNQMNMENTVKLYVLVNMKFLCTNIVIVKMVTCMIMIKIVKLYVQNSKNLVITLYVNVFLIITKKVKNAG